MSGDQFIKCPHCKKTVDLSATQSKHPLLLVAIICVIFAGTIGFGLGATLNRTSKQKIEEANTKIARLGNEIEQLRTQKQQEEIAKQNADLEKRKIQELIGGNSVLITLSGGSPIKGRSNGWTNQFWEAMVPWLDLLLV